MFESLMQLTHSEAFFAPYLLVYALGFLAAVSLYKSKSRVSGSTVLSGRERHLCNIGAVFFTVLISGANYPLWLEYSLGASTPAVLRAAYGVVMLAFGKLWFQLGLRHPVTYLKAFVDITCGYWNSGYPSAPWCNFLVENDLGLHLTKPVPILNMLFDRYVGAFDDFFVLQLMICTGLFVWVYLLAGWICLLRKDKLGGILCVPVLCVAQTLILGVPVACDLRYIYCAFCGLPFVLALSTRPGSD